MTITEFLLARIAEDENVARHPSPMFPMVGAAHHSWELGVNTDRDYQDSTIVIDPARVLAECEAKRLIVDLHTPVDDEADGWCNRCDGDGWPCGTMAALASVYSDHPDYDEAWRA